MDTFIHHAPTIGLLFFFIVFVGIAAWAWHPKRKKCLEKLAHIPLNEEISNDRK